MKRCKCCNNTSSDNAATCPACGEASWSVGAPSHTKKARTVRGKRQKSAVSAPQWDDVDEGTE